MKPSLKTHLRRAIEDTYMPENSYGIRPGYYSNSGIARLLRRHKNNPQAIRFIADMME